MPADRPRPARSVGELPADTTPHANTHGGPAGAVPLPANVGLYEVARLLGRGGMGAVYECREAALKRTVAVKVMLPDLAGQAMHKARFVREAQAQARVEHDHIIPIYRVGEAGGVPFIVMPLLKGGTLADYLKHGVPPLAEAVRIGREMTDGLAAAHAAGLVHRDVKPANVGLDGPRRRVKLLDFGLARPVVPEGGDEPMTHSGAIVGTPAYMSPEQARGKPVDHRTDLFALGVVLYELLVGRRPFLGADVMSLLSALALDQPDDPAAVNPAVPPALSGLVMRLLSKKPDDRPADATAVADELRAIEGRLSAVQVVDVRSADPFAELDTVSRPAVAAVPEKRRRPWGWLALGLAVLAAGGLLAVQVFVHTPKGTLVIESDDPSVEVVVKKDGAVLLDKTAKREIELAVGDYGIELAEKKDGLRLTTDKFEIVRGGKAVVRVRLEKPKAAVPPPAPPATVATPVAPSPAGFVDERRLAEQLIPFFRLWVLPESVPLPDGYNWIQATEVLASSPLPPGPLRVLRVVNDSNTSAGTLPAQVFREIAPQLRVLRAVSDWGDQLGIRSPADLDWLATLPCAGQLSEIVGKFDATPEIVTRLKRFSNLVNLGLTGRQPSADQLDQLVEALPKVRYLAFNKPPLILTPRMAKTLARLPAHHLFGVALGDPAVARVLAAMPLVELSVSLSGPAADACLAELAAARAGGSLSPSGDLTDAGLNALDGRTTSTSISFTPSPTLTPDAARRLAGRVPGCKVYWDGKLVTPAVAPPVPPPAPVPPAAEPQPPKPANTRDERPTIATLAPLWDVTVRTDAGDVVTVKHGEPLPAGKLVLLGLYDDNRGKSPFPPGYAADVLIPNVRKCPDLTTLDAFNCHHWLTEDETLTLLGGQARKLGNVSGVYLPLTAGVLDGIRRYKGAIDPPVFTTLSVHAAAADDVLIARLAALKGVQGLWLRGVGTELRLNGKGVEAVGKMPLTFLAVCGSKGLTAADVRKAAAGPKLSGFNLSGSDLDDAAAAGLADTAATDIGLYGTTLTDRAVPHLLKLTKATRLNVEDTKLTAAGAQTLADGLPACTVWWGGKKLKPGG